MRTIYFVWKSIIQVVNKSEQNYTAFIVCCVMYVFHVSGTLAHTLYCTGEIRQLLQRVVSTEGLIMPPEDFLL